MFNSSDHRYFIKYFNTFLNPSMRKSYLIKKMNANEANKEKILAELNEYLTEDRDRKLFNL